MRNASPVIWMPAGDPPRRETGDRLEDVGSDPGLRRPAGALPPDLVALDPGQCGNAVRRVSELIGVGVTDVKDANRERVGREHDERISALVIGPLAQRLGDTCGLELAEALGVVPLGDGEERRIGLQRRLGPSEVLA